MEWTDGVHGALVTVILRATVARELARHGTALSIKPFATNLLVDTIPSLHVHHKEADNVRP